MKTDQMDIKRKGSLDYSLILATVGVLFGISVICIFGMFYFKLANIQQLPPMEKYVYMNRMNLVVAPFIITLILLLGICVPKRLLPVRWLVVFGALLTGTAIGVAAWKGIITGLIVVLTASLLLQVVVLGMAVLGSRRLHFEKSGYWVRVGSSLIHMGVILFVLDLILYKNLSLHLFLFWVTTVSTVLGMLFCFYAQGVARSITRVRQASGRRIVDRS